MVQLFLRILGIFLVLFSPLFDVKAEETKIVLCENPWIRASQGPNAALFMTLVNKSDKPMVLCAAHLQICAYTELHTHREEGGVFRMRSVKTIEIPAQGRQELKPGGYHIMLMKLSAALRAGDQVNATLTFQTGETLKLTIPVKGMEEEPCSCS